MAREVDSLSVQKQLNALFEQRLGSENEILKTMQKELQVAIQLQTVLGKLSTEDLAKNIDASAEAIKKLSSESKETGDIGSKAMKSISENAKKTEKSSMQMGSSFKGLTAVLGGVATTALGVGKSMFNIGKSILSIPFGIFKNLMSDAASFVGDTAFAQALENVRKEFGSFKEGTSKDILGAYSTMNTQLQAVSGLSVWRVFEGPADQLKYIQEMASKAGSQILQFGGEIAKSAGIIATFDKGMGIGAENMKGMMDRAIIFGTTLEKQLGDVANYALQMGKDFGISSKIISREVGNMQKDVRNFGSLTVKQMTVAAVYTKKLGLEMKDLTGLVGQFDNFDKAAESAGLLSQAFGASVDAFKLMNEQDPAKRLDELRKSMNAAGKSSENMSRQELHLLASTAGLSDEAAKLAFSTKNQGLSYDQVQKQANKAENSQMKQAEALTKLADNIERVVRSGGQMQNSFFKMFVSGMEKGVKTSGVYIGAMQSVRSALWATHMAGLEVGRGIAKSGTLGFGLFMKDFGDTFSPKTINKIMHGAKNAAGKQGRGVVDELNDVFNGKQGVSSAVENIRKHFNGAIDHKTFQNMIIGGKQMMTFVAKGLGSGLSFVAKEMTHVLTTITDFIKNPKEFLSKIKAQTQGAQGFAGTLVSQFAEGFGNPAVLNSLLIALKDLMHTVFTKLSTSLMHNSTIHSILGKGLMGMIANVGIKAAAGNAGSIIKFVGPMLKQVGPAMSGLAKSMGPMISQAASALAPVAGPLAAVAAIAAIGLAATGMNNGLKKYGAKLVGQGMEPTKAKISAASAGIVDALTFGLLDEGTSLQIGKAVGDFSDMILKSVGNVFGPQFAKSLKEFFSSSVDLGAAFGEVISAIFSGDTDKMMDSAGELALKWFKWTNQQMALFIDMIPKLAIKIQAFATKMASTFAEKMTDAFNNLGDKLGPFGAFFKGLALVTDVMSTFYKLSYVGFKMLGQWWDSINISGKFGDLSTSVTGVGTTITEFFTDDIPKAIKGFLSDVFGVSGQQFDDFIKMITDAIDKIKSVVGDVVNSDFVQANIKGIKKIRDSYKDLKNDVNAASNLLDNQDKLKAAAQKQTASAAPNNPFESKEGIKEVTPSNIKELMSQKKSLEENLKGLQKFAEGPIIKSISDAIPKASGALTEFNDKLSKSGISSTLEVTQGIVASINALNSSLGDGSAGAIKIGEKLQKYANNSGLGKNGTYEIKNKGINLKLDLKITMDAGEVERAIVLRKDSIIFDAIEDSASLSMSQEHKNQLAATKAGH